jgi:hypothetical protein
MVWILIPNDGKAQLMEGDKVAICVSIGMNNKDRQWSFKLIPHWVALFKNNGPRHLYYQSPQKKEYAELYSNKAILKINIWFRVFYLM